MQLKKKTFKLKASAKHIDLTPYVTTKAACQLVYRTELGKVVTISGIIRDVFLQQNPPLEVAVLENGLPIPIHHILHIRRMEG